MWLTQADELKNKTQTYWQVSSEFYGRLPGKLSMGSAITVCQTHQEELNPSRLLHARWERLQWALINGRKRPKKLVTPNIIPLKAVNG